MNKELPKLNLIKIANTALFNETKWSITLTKPLFADAFKVTRSKFLRLIGF